MNKPPVELIQEPMADYLAADAINSSILRAVHNSSEAHAAWNLANPKTSKAFDLGNASHLVLLQPKRLDSDFLVRPEGLDGRRNPGRQILRELKQQAVDEGKTFLDDPQAGAMLRQCVETVYTNDLALALLTHPDAVIEGSHYWSERDTQCKARPDAYSRHPDTDQWVRVDVKTMPSVHPRSVTQSVLKFGYHLQAAHWPADDPTPFFIIAVERQPPFTTVVYELTADWLDIGRQQRDAALVRWLRAVERDDYPGYPNQPLECPSWLLPELEGFTDES